jgi:hypothetical protein
MVTRRGSVEWGNFAVVVDWLRFSFWMGRIGIKRTKLCLVRCRAQMEMPTREQLRDARADKEPR